MTDNEVKIINNTITRYLARREHSQVELFNKLLAKQLPKNLISQQIQAFADNNIQSNYRFTESFVRSSVAKGQGEYRIRRGLTEHEIDTETIENVLIELNIDWYELVEKVIRKKFANENNKDWQQNQKMSRFLQYRGNTQEQIQHAIESLSW